MFRNIAFSAAIVTAITGFSMTAGSMTATAASNGASGKSVANQAAAPKEKSKPKLTQGEQPAQGLSPPTNTAITVN